MEKRPPVLAKTLLSVGKNERNVECGIRNAECLGGSQRVKIFRIQNSTFRIQVSPNGSPPLPGLRLPAGPTWGGGGKMRWHHGSPLRPHGEGGFDVNGGAIVE